MGDQAVEGEAAGAGEGDGCNHNVVVAPGSGDDAWLAALDGLGLEISEKGLLFATKEGPSGAHVDVAIDVDTRSTS